MPLARSMSSIGCSCSAAGIVTGSVWYMQTVAGTRWHGLKEVGCIITRDVGWRRAIDVGLLQDDPPFECFSHEESLRMWFACLDLCQSR